jgi:anti-anti-sigma factor
MPNLPHESVSQPACAGSVLTLTGSMDLAAAERLQREVVQWLEGEGPVWLDWSQAEYLSAAVIQVLLAFEASLARRGRDLQVSADQEDIRRYLELAGVSGKFRVRPQAA